MRILVVEDEKQIANAIKRGLEQESYSVDTAYSGFDGYDLANTEEYDLIILDWMLPEMNGLELCKKIRDDQGHWEPIEVYIRNHSEAKFSHGICPICAKELYPDFYKGK